MRREEYEAADEGDSVNAESFEIGFQRASEDLISKRRIVKARSRNHPPVVTKSQATAIEDKAIKSNPFGGFQVCWRLVQVLDHDRVTLNWFGDVLMLQGLTAAKPAASNGVSGLSDAVQSDIETTSRGTNVASFKSYQEAMETLNKEFLAFVTGQLQRNPSVSWMAAVQVSVVVFCVIVITWRRKRRL